MRKPGVAPGRSTHEILPHWREAVPHDRLAHLVKDAELSRLVAGAGKPRGKR